MQDQDSTPPLPAEDTISTLWNLQSLQQLASLPTPACEEVCTSLVTMHLQKHGVVFEEDKMLFFIEGILFPREIKVDLKFIFPWCRSERILFTLGWYYLGVVGDYLAAEVLFSQCISKTQETASEVTIMAAIANFLATPAAGKLIQFTANAPEQDLPKAKLSARITASIAPKPHNLPIYGYNYTEFTQWLMHEFTPAATHNCSTAMKERLTQAMAIKMLERILAHARQYFISISFAQLDRLYHVPREAGGQLEREVFGSDGEFIVLA